MKRNRSLEHNTKQLSPIRRSSLQKLEEYEKQQKQNIEIIIRKYSNSKKTLKPINKLSKKSYLLSSNTPSVTPVLLTRQLASNIQLSFIISDVTTIQEISTPVEKHISNSKRVLENLKETNIYNKINVIDVFINIFYSI